MYVTFCTFLFSAYCIGTCGKYFSQGAAGISVLLYLFHFYENNIFTLDAKDFAWPGYIIIASYSPDT
jgi:hypothetical protein